MKAEERRKGIADTLTSDAPISASVLATRFGVSRQIIVGDIALLRASGMNIIATPRGYRLGEKQGEVYTVPCVHTQEDTETELLAIVDNGCTVLNVVVEHPLYGEIAGQLSLSSRYDVQQFMEKSRTAKQLASLTDGIHLHNITCPNEDAYIRVCKALDEAGILYKTPDGAEKK